MNIIKYYFHTSEKKLQLDWKLHTIKYSVHKQYYLDFPLLCSQIKCLILCTFSLKHESRLMSLWYPM